MRKFLTVLVVFMLATIAYAQGDVPAPSVPAPVLQVLQMVLTFVTTSFPKAGPIIQLVLEIIASIATFFTLLTVFVSGCLHIPLVIAKFAKAEELAAKIQKLHDKIVPILKYASIFNVKK